MDDVIELSFGGSVREKGQKASANADKPNASKPIDAPTAAQLTTCPCHELAGVARGIAGEFTLEGRRQREAAQPLHFAAGADQGSVGIAARAVHHEACARQRLE